MSYISDMQRQYVPEHNLDKNWAWPTLVAVTATIFLTSGPTDNLGVLVSYWIDYFDTSKATASWVPSIHTCCFLLAAPFASVLAPMFSYRKLVIVGAAMTFTGWTVSFFATEIWHLYFSLGILAGIGGGISSFTAYALLPLYFDRKKQLASSVVQFGNAIASVFLPVIYSRLTEKYSWQGACLICGAFTLNLLPASILILDPIKLDLPPPQQRRRSSSSLPKNSEKMSIHTTQQQRASIQMLDNAVTAEDVTDASRHNSSSNHQRPNKKKVQLQNDDSSIPSNSYDLKHLLSTSHNVVPDDYVDDEDEKRKSTGIFHIKTSSSSPADAGAASSSSSMKKSLPRTAKQHKRLITQKSIETTTSIQPDDDDNDDRLKKPQSLFRSVWNDKRMWLLAAHTILMDFFFIKLFLVVRYATEELHYSLDEAALLLSFQAGGILFARTILVMTTLFSRSSFLIWSLFHLGTLTMGVCILIYPHILPVMSLFVNEILIGFGWGAKFGLLPGITMDVMGREKFGITWALMATLACFSVLFSPPLAGWLTDRTGSFKSALYLSGVCQLLSVIPALILQWIHYGDEQEKKKQRVAREWGYEYTAPSSAQQTTAAAVAAAAVPQTTSTAQTRESAAKISAAHARRRSSEADVSAGASTAQAPPPDFALLERLENINVSLDSHHQKNFQQQPHRPNKTATVGAVGADGRRDRRSASGTAGMLLMSSLPHGSNSTGSRFALPAGVFANDDAHIVNVSSVFHVASGSNDDDDFSTNTKKRKAAAAAAAAAASEKKVSPTGSTTQLLLSAPTVSAVGGLEERSVTPSNHNPV